jgi:hypothetical protein
MSSKAMLAVVLVTTILLSGCATYTTTLTNAKGETVACKAQGKDGIVTGYYLRKGFEKCVSNAEAHGFKQAEGTSSN